MSGQGCGPRIALEGVTKLYPVVKRSEERGRLFRKKVRDTVKALDDVSLEARSGEILGVLGPNGAGKTTLIKIMAGVLMQEEGCVSVNGFDTISQRERVRTSVSLLRSGGWVIFDYKLSVFKNLQFWGVFHEGLRLGDSEERIRDVLALVDLEEKMYDFPENLSAGMRQKMCLALTLLSPRPIYLMDEPTANIDPLSADRLRKFFRRELADRGKCIVLTTHNLWEAEEICDRIVILDKGKILAFTTAKELRENTGSEAVVLRVSRRSIELLEGVRSLAFVDSVIEEDVNNIFTVYGDVKSHMVELLSEVSGHALVEHVETREPSLNDIFLQIVGGGL